jgi:hypothetical protein
MTGTRHTGSGRHPRTKQWTVRIDIDEEGEQTRARAVLTPGPGEPEQPAGQISGQGLARRSPVDRQVAEIGDELAASRALEDLAVRLHDAAADDIVQLGGPVDWALP